MDPYDFKSILTQGLGSTEFRKLGKKKKKQGRCTAHVCKSESNKQWKVANPLTTIFEFLTLILSQWYLY